MTAETKHNPAEQVGIGCLVEIELINREGDGERMTVTLVREQAANMEQNLLGANTPLAKAILGKYVGRVVSYQMGDVQSVRIVSVQRDHLTAAADTAERRAAILEKARSAAERTNAEMFAASFNGKWGDYNLPENEV
ncbi:MAG: GreA/GreB family elongation factor [Caldilineaceae bacterium]|nr:GreA/GreB family elongation factor [Caldilineaceae bacterium]